MDLDVSPRLCAWVLDYLTSRKQYVCTCGKSSSMININNFGTAGLCVISCPVHSLCLNNEHYIILKFADDTILVGLIKDNDESHSQEGSEIHQ